MDYDDPRLRLIAKLSSNGLTYKESKEMVDDMTDEEVDQALKPFIKKEMDNIKQFLETV